MEDYTKAAIRFGGQTCGAGAAPAGGCPGPVRLLGVNRAGALRQVVCVHVQSNTTQRSRAPVEAERDLSLHFDTNARDRTDRGTHDTLDLV